MTETASLLSLFLGSFFAATLLPGGSEAVLFGVLRSYPETLWPALLIATVGNTLGGMVSFGIGWLLPQTRQLKHVEKLWSRHGEAELPGAGMASSHLLPQTAGFASSVSKVRRYGAPVLLLAWVPLIGDALCLAAGWLRLNWWQAALFMAIGKFTRYWVIAMSMQSALIFSF
ncbi:MAG: DedA family protein [Gallionella sp.]|nr:DedA family protein [Gallionella sp.]